MSYLFSWLNCLYWRRYLMAGLLCGLGLPGFSQADTTSHPTRDRAAADSLPLSYAATVTDSLLTQRDSLFYSRLRKKMYKHRITRQIYDALFQDVYNSHASMGEVEQIDVNPFKPYEGKVIGTISIRQLGVFGQSVYDTLRKPGNWFERTGNRIHTNTRERVIRRSYLLFNEGDLVDATVMRNNERLLRTNANGIFLDARIVLVPRAGEPSLVDVFVITQDVWSLLPTGGISSLTNFSLGFEQKNVRGVGHQFGAQASYAGNEPNQPWEYRTRYIIPFIGKTFMTAQAQLQYLRDLKQVSVRLNRPFLTPDTKWAGSFEYNHTLVNYRFINRLDSAVLVPLRYNFSDIWVGRSFRLSPGQDTDNPKGRVRLVVGLRNTNYVYVNRPTVTADTNQVYQNSNTVLTSVGVNRRRYVRDVLIYGFGRTEDVPVGESFAGVVGVDNAELGQRLYLGLNLSRGKYYPKVGYLYGLVSGGSYLRSGRLEQGVLSVEVNFFSPLLKTKWGSMRHFLNSRQTSGIGRFENESISLTSSGADIITDGFSIDNDALRGTKRWFVTYENVLFSRINVIGFRVAFTTFVNLGLVSYPGQSLVRGPVYQGYGIGFRLRNENLTFSSFQIRLSYYPNIPGNTAPFRQSFEGIPTLRFRDFDLSAPQIIPYR